jgi:20S proteasome subunit beta 3
MAAGGENALDSAGAYAATGTSARSLYGMCEAFYSADLEPDELAEVVGKCLLAALERDCLSGQGAVVHLLTAEGVTSRELSARHD